MKNYLYDKLYINRVGVGIPGFAIYSNDIDIFQNSLKTDLHQVHEAYEIKFPDQLITKQITICRMGFQQTTSSGFALVFPNQSFKISKARSSFDFKVLT